MNTEGRRLISTFHEVKLLLSTAVNQEVVVQLYAFVWSWSLRISCFLSYRTYRCNSDPRIQIVYIILLLTKSAIFSISSATCNMFTCQNSVLIAQITFLFYANGLLHRPAFASGKTDGAYFSKCEYECFNSCRICDNKSCATCPLGWKK